MSLHEVVIIAAQRTAIGAFLGQFADIPATDLGAATIRAVLQNSGLTAEQIDEVIMGCVLSAGLGQAPARQAALSGGLPRSVGCTTINKVCGSGLEAIRIGRNQILAGSADAIIAGGMESMSRAPYLLPKARRGYRFGHQQAVDHMVFDGLENATDGKSMGWFGEQCAEQYGFSREAQDDFASESVTRALKAMGEGQFRDEICRVGEFVEDEEPGRCDLAKIPKIPPAFRDNGTVTAASSASIGDGAAAVVLCRESLANALEITPLARITGIAHHAQAPETFTTAPIHAIQKLYQQTGWTDNQVDLYEINEAFASVVMAAMTDLEINHAKVNVNGGACALGHPIGATGVRLIVTLLHALRQRGLKRGIAALCIGGGEALATAVELV